MLSSFKSFRQVLRYLRIFMLLFLVLLFGIGLYFILFSTAAVVSVMSSVLIFFIALMFLSYDTLRDQQQSSNSLLLESKRLFIRYVSHEIRSPLNTVHLGLRLLLQEMQGLLDSQEQKEQEQGGMGEVRRKNMELVEIDLAPPLKEKLVEWAALIDDVEESTDRVVRVLNDLIHSDGLVSGTLRISRRSVNLFQVVQRAVQQFRGQAARCGVSLQLLDMGIGMEMSEAMQAMRGMERVVGNEKQSAEGMGDLERLRVVGDEGKLDKVVGMLLGSALRNAGRGGRVLVSVHWEPAESEGEAIQGRKGKGPSSSFSYEMSSRLSHRQNDNNNNSNNNNNNNKNTTTTTTNNNECESMGSLVVTVSDSGPSLTPEQLEEVFGEEEEVQFNLKLLRAGDVDRGGEGGRGRELELWIAKGIVELHHGRLSVLPASSAPLLTPILGEGDFTSFQVTLPAVVWRRDLLEEGMLSPRKYNDRDSGIYDLEFDGDGDDDGDEVKEAEASSSDSLALDLSYNVLVVEDSTPSRKLLCRLLTNLGCRCTQAENGVECLEKVHKNLESSYLPPFDFILMDFEMPRMNGPDTARTLRAEGYFTPIIGVTGNVLPEDQQYFLCSGANRVLRKPLSLPLLEKTLLDMIVLRKDEVSYLM